MNGMPVGTHLRAVHRSRSSLAGYSNGGRGAAIMHRNGRDWPVQRAPVRRWTVPRRSGNTLGRDLINRRLKPFGVAAGFDRFGPWLIDRNQCS